MPALTHYVFGEAFMLMKYVGEKSGRIEWLWNSRDGVTPFMIGSPEADLPGTLGADGAVRAPDGVEVEMMQHADWQEDCRAPRFVPPVGMRIFVSYTPEAAEAAARRFHERFGRELTEQYEHLREIGEEKLLQTKIEEIYGDGNQPNVVTVDKELRDFFERRAREPMPAPVPPGTRRPLPWNKN